jgi:hypothetical protein
VSQHVRSIDSATDEDLQKVFGSRRLLIGTPVRPRESTKPSWLIRKEQQRRLGSHRSGLGR